MSQTAKLEIKNYIARDGVDSDKSVRRETAARQYISFLLTQDPLLRDEAINILRELEFNDEEIREEFQETSKRIKNRDNQK